MRTNVNVTRCDVRKVNNYSKCPFGHPELSIPTESFSLAICTVLETSVQSEVMAS